MVILKNNFASECSSSDSFANFKKSIKEYEIFKTRDNKEVMYIDAENMIREKILIWKK